MTSGNNPGGLPARAKQVGRTYGALLERGLQARRNMDHEAALASFESAITACLDQANYRPFLLAATEMRSLGRTAEAEPLFREVLTRKSANLQALRALARARNSATIMQRHWRFLRRLRRPIRADGNQQT